MSTAGRGTAKRLRALSSIGAFLNRGGRGAFAAMSGGVLASVAPALALAVAAALPAVAPRGFWTSVRFSARVVRCRLRRPGETPALGGVSGRFGLRNRPKVASGVRLR